MQRTVLGRYFLCSLIVAMPLVTGLEGQRRRGMPAPPPPVVPDQPAAETKTPARPDTFSMEREARELSALAASIPGDVEQLQKGLLPKDAVETLKRIEKLSKQLRGQIQQ